jgi:hypothetical protein
MWLSMRVDIQISSYPVNQQHKLFIGEVLKHSQKKWFIFSQEMTKVQFRTPTNPRNGIIYKFFLNKHLQGIPIFENLYQVVKEQFLLIVVQLFLRVAANFSHELINSS